MASVRGFIRGYAKVLKIDAVPLLAMIAKETVVLQEPAVLRRSSKRRTPNRVCTHGRSALRAQSIFVAAILGSLLVGMIVMEKLAGCRRWPIL